MCRFVVDIRPLKKRALGGHSPEAIPSRARGCEAHGPRGGADCDPRVSGPALPFLFLKRLCRAERSVPTSKSSVGLLDVYSCSCRTGTGISRSSHENFYQTSETTFS